MSQSQNQLIQIASRDPNKLVRLQTSGPLMEDCRALVRAGIFERVSYFVFRLK